MTSWICKNIKMCSKDVSSQSLTAQHHPVITLLTALVAVFGTAVAARSRDVTNIWPAVAPIKRSFDISGHKVAIKLEIKDTGGNPIYLLECHDADYEERYFDYSGLIQCRMTTIGNRTPRDNYNALTYDVAPDQDWESRARFSTDDMTGKCTNYPEWGKTRSIRLRGMILTLAVNDLKFDANAPDDAENQLSYRFTIEVRPDPEALSAIEGPYHFVEPSDDIGDCARVLPLHVPGEVTPDYIRSNRLGPPYPAILPVQSEFHFEVGEDKPYELAILDRDRKPAYSLRCSAEPWTAVTDWSLRCSLLAVGSNVDLLADSVDPFTRRSRAVFMGGQSSKKCRDYPEWGTSRTFALRGMKIAFGIDGNLENNFATLTKDPADGKKFGLNIRVTPDPSAQSPVAMPIEIVDWSLLGPQSCQEVLTYSPRSRAH